MSETKMQLVDWLDDLCVRFIINLPQEELESVERICFQVEEAQWYYEDFIRPLDPELPSLSLRNFCLRIFQHCPLLSEFSPYHHATAFEEFLAYKTRVPVRGAIMLNDEMDEVVLVKGWKKGANWSFPRGKINKDESDLACATREVYEETGYDIEAAGLVISQDTVKYIDVAIQHQHIRLYVFRGVPMNTPFEARTRKEISKIEWWKLSDLPTLKKKKQQQEGRGEDLAVNANKFYMVAPFLVPLKKWISQQKKMEKSRSTDQLQFAVDNDVEEPLIEENELNGNGTVSTSEDMERLLAGLRQPASVPLTSKTQLPRTMSSVDEASSQLKSLLRVPAMNQTAAQTQTADAVRTLFPSTSTEEKRASALLALLRGGPPTEKAPAPHTPTEEIKQTLSVLESPKPQQTVLPCGPTQLPPPTFPLSPENVREGHTDQSSTSNAEAIHSRPINGQKASIDAWNRFETTSAEQEAARRKGLAERHAARLAEEQRTGILHEPTLPVMNETWRQVKVNRNTNMRQANSRHVSNTVKRSVGGPHQPQQHQPIQQQAARNVAPQPAPAPYQATSNVQVAANLQYPDIYRPVIPAANKLPMPKITAHSSSLLNLFKGGQSAEAAKGSSVADANTGSQAISHVPTAQTLNRQTPQRLSGGQMPDLGSGSPKPLPLSMQKAAESMRPQSAHQATLLDLFRKPSVPAIGPTSLPKSTLDAPANLIELSATPSPRHSRESSKAEVQRPEKVIRSTSNKPVSLQNRPQANNAASGKPPVFATVNGPLNEPQFDMIANKAKESRHTHTIAKEAKRSPVRILARPASTKLKSSLDEPGTSKPGDQLANGPAVPHSAGQNADTHRPPTPKQILRRPVQSEKPQTQQEPFLLPPVRPPSQQRETPSPLSASDDRLPPKPSHKATLLSLFTKASPPVTSSETPPRPDMSAFVSPVAAKPPSFFSAPPKVTNKTYAGAPALNGMAYTQDGIGNAESRDNTVGGQSRHAPKKTTSDVDRNFLLGYLESVARKEGKSRLAAARLRYVSTTASESATPNPPRPPSTGYAHLTNRALISVYGCDAAHYLQGLTTSNIKTTASSSSGFYSSFLNAQGRVLYDVFIYPANQSAAFRASNGGTKKGEPGFLIDVDKAHVEALSAQLKRFKLRAKISLRIIDPGEWDVWSTWGRDDDITGDAAHLQAEAIGCVDTRAPGMGRRMVTGVGQRPKNGSGEETSVGTYDMRRILNGVPQGHDEIISGEALPQESNIDYMGGIDFRKGCYVGQELTIRTHHTGVVRKRILPVQLYAMDEEPPEVLEYDPESSVLPNAAQNIGRVNTRGRSAGKWLKGVGNVGLALCRLETMTDVRLTEEASQWSPENEFKMSWQLDGGEEKELKIKAFVPEWHRDRVGIRDMQPRPNA
ncbi:MAG: hypothetical protein Q9188_004513 [Gyalolechia gomerana]